MKNIKTGVVFANHIKDISNKKKKDYVRYCPKCNNRLTSVANTYDGIPFMQVTYCGKCQWHLQENE